MSSIFFSRWNIDLKVTKSEQIKHIFNQTCIGDSEKHAGNLLGVTEIDKLGYIWTAVCD